MTKDLMEKAKEYSFNIESQLFPTLNAEQQKLWKQEIEQAYMAGAGVNTQDQIDALRMEYEKGRADAISNPTGGEFLHVLNKGAAIGRREMLDKVCQYLFENYHGEKLSLRMIEDLRKAMEEQQ